MPFAGSHPSSNTIAVTGRHPGLPHVGSHPFLNTAAVTFLEKSASGSDGHWDIMDDPVSRTIPTEGEWDISVLMDLFVE